MIADERLSTSLLVFAADFRCSRSGVVAEERR